MSTALANRNQGNGIAELPSQDVAHAITGAIEQLKAIRSFIQAQFSIGYKDRDGKIVPGIDAGLIPGCGDKPTLFLPGAQKATMYFNCYPTFKVKEKDLGNGHVEYRVRCILISRATGEQVCEGVGSCSTMEKKYRYRGNAIVCPRCSKPAIRKSKDKPEFYCWRKIEGCGATFNLKEPAILSQGDGSPSENPDIYDVHNTVLKIGKKRAHVDAAITLGCLSELFTQDIEDTYRPEEILEAARPYEGEVMDYRESEPQPSEPQKFSRAADGPKHPNNSGYGRGEYADPVQIAYYKTKLEEVVGNANAQWADFWQDPKANTIPEPARKEPLTIWQVDNHLVKWAVEEERIDPDALQKTGQARLLGGYVAILLYRDKESGKAVYREMGRYVADVFGRKKDAIYRKHPELAPDGYLEELAEANGDAPDDFEAAPDDEPTDVQAEEAAPASPAPTPGPLPRSGRALFAWVKEQEQRHEVGLLKYINAWAKLQDFPGRMVDWDHDQVNEAYAEAVRKIQTISSGHAEAYEEALA